jgi:hypothetical protein
VRQGCRSTSLPRPQISLSRVMLPRSSAGATVSGDGAYGSNEFTAMYCIIARIHLACRLWRHRCVQADLPASVPQAAGLSTRNGPSGTQIDCIATQRHSQTGRAVRRAFPNQVSGKINARTVGNIGRELFDPQLSSVRKKDSTVTGRSSVVVCIRLAKAPLCFATVIALSISKSRLEKKVYWG